MTLTTLSLTAVSAAALLAAWHAGARHERRKILSTRAEWKFLLSDAVDAEVLVRHAEGELDDRTGEGDHICHVRPTRRRGASEFFGSVLRLSRRLFGHRTREFFQDCIRGAANLFQVNRLSSDAVSDVRNNVREARQSAVKR